MSCVVLWNWWRCFLILLVFCPLACVFLSCSALSSQGHHIEHISLFNSQQARQWRHFFVQQSTGRTMKIFPCSTVNRQDNEDISLFNSQQAGQWRHFFVQQSTGRTMKIFPCSTVNRQDNEDISLFNSQQAGQWRHFLVQQPTGRTLRKRIAFTWKKKKAIFSEIMVI